MITNPLYLTVLDRFSDDLLRADETTLYDLACRAEGCYCTELGRCMRELVDHERAARTALR